MGEGKMLSKSGSKDLIQPICKVKKNYMTKRFCTSFNSYSLIPLTGDYRSECMEENMVFRLTTLTYRHI